MSEKAISFNGDALAQRVPLLGEFKEELIGTIDPLMSVAECRWAGEDEQSQAVRAIVMNLLGNQVLGILGLLANASGFQGEKLGLYHRNGVYTEDGSNDMVPDMSGGHRG
ncbi:hypothetical protein ACFY2R_20355 [Micromonospora olivasterospora]|uniref:Uncharacterized protein n=1 Tax=Micromonospora olivasterospora TaxID=1880 RepID=A0A562IHZ7_MICOL|nr:hypothetical protein [Micromonospora olivasterospora]TWH70647.1 hypothetical protein JD77_05672 [Micromonospora olivasterospora]